MGGVETSRAALMSAKAAASCFNGATPWEAWKREVMGEGRGAASVELQWGHALGGVETR